LFLGAGTITHLAHLVAQKLALQAEEARQEPEGLAVGSAAIGGAAVGGAA
jgi:hypothetical protein